MCKGFVIFQLLLILHWGAYAANFFSSTNISIENGLSQSSVQAVCQDQNGFIWFATHDGLNRFDGYAVKVWNVSEFDPQGYQSNNITSLLSDKNGNLWFGTLAGVYRIRSNNEAVEPFRVNSSRQNPLGEKIQAIKLIQRKNGEVLLLSQFKIFRLEQDSMFVNITSFSDEMKDVPQQFNSIYEDNTGKLWLGTTEGLFVYDETKKLFTKTESKDKITVTEILETANGDLIISTLNGLYTLRHGEAATLNAFQIENAPDIVQINQLYKDNDNCIWIGTTQNGLYKFSPALDKLISTYSTKNKLLASNQITSIFEDKTGLMWIGSYDQGAFILDMKEQMIKLFENNDKELTYVTSLEKTQNSKNKMWVGTTDHGILIADYSNIDKPLIKAPDASLKCKFGQSPINDILASGNKLYIATQTMGLCKITLQGETWVSQENYQVLVNGHEIKIGQADNLAIGKDGNIWFSNELHGLCYFDTKKDVIRKFDFAPSSNNKETANKGLDATTFNISEIYASPDGNLWIGTNGNGLFRLTFEENGTVKTTLIDNRVTGNMFINCLLDYNNNLWIGTQGMGLYCFDIKNQTIKRIEKSSRLANKVIHAIESDNLGNIWLSTNKGLSKYDIDKDEVTNYTSTSHLQGYEFNNNAISKDGNGTIFFGGNNGINYYIPQEQKKKYIAPKVLISELQINNQPVIAGCQYNGRVVLNNPIYKTPKVDLYFEDKTINFTISPIYYSDAQNNTFYYKLEPYEKEWVERDATNRYISYNNLKGGTYHLKVKAKNSDGIFSEEKQLTIVVHPPLWKQTWFVILIYILGAALIGLIFSIWYYNQKGREHQLEYEKNIMQSLIDNIPDTIYLKDLESKFIRVNKAQTLQLGCNDTKQVIGKSDFDFLGQAQAEGAYNAEQEIIHTGVPVINKLRKATIEGDTHYFSDTKIAIYDKEKKCIGTVGISRDITDLKLAEEAMLESQAKFKALFENAPLAIFRIDKNQRIVEYNYRFRKMFGYSQTDNILGITTSDLLVDPDLGKLIFETVLETKEVSSEILLKRKDGETFIATLTLSLLEEGFKEVSIEGIIEDITQMAQARDEIIKAKDKAVEADKLKSLFLANMSHEIRTPMNAIIGFTNMLREEELAKEERDSFIDVIQSNGNNLVSLIDSIVDFSKLEAEQMSVSISEFNVNPLLDTVCDHAQKTLISEGKEHIKLIKSKESEEAVRVISDRHRLTQVFNHLISNAVKFCDQGEIEIGYFINHETVTMFVRDTGIGIPKNKHEYIFQRFAKVEDKNRLYGGTGIGLTISKGLIELMGGSITVDSEPGKGSTFFIHLPIKTN